MSKTTKKMVVPRVRFPEFQIGESWETHRMGALFEFQSNNSLSRDKLNYETGAVKNIHYGDIHTKFKTLFRIRDELVPYINETESLERVKPESYCIEGDMVFADASEDLEDIGKGIELVELQNERLLSGLHTILARPKKEIFATGFAGYLFKSSPIRFQIRKEAQGAKVLGISARKMAGMDLLFPKNKKEQQKISDCLSSLDDLITAQTDHVAALKQYKKGLLQQLFPQDGETVPRRRFPEFRKDGGWSLMKLGEVLQDTPRPIEMHDNEVYSLVTVKRRYGGVVARENLEGRSIKVKSQFIVKADDFLISKRQIVHNACGLVPLELEGSIVSNEYSILTPKVGYDIKFFNYFSQQPCVSESFLQSSVGIVIEKMLFKLDSWLKLDFLFPGIKEQQRIASCLKEIENQIAAQSEMLLLLQAHKKGLLQQLFPSLTEGDDA